MSNKIQGIVDDAKKRHRTDLPLSHWQKDGFASSNVYLPTDDPFSCILPREKAKSLSVSRFLKEYETPHIPVLITGIPKDEQWKATTTWKLEKLKKEYKHAMWKCGEDDDGKTIRVKFRHFCKYMKVMMKYINYHYY